MADNPYRDLTLAELMERRAYLLDVLNGKTMKSFGGQGSNFTRELPTMADARQDLALVNDVIATLGGDERPTRTIFRHA